MMIDKPLRLPIIACVAVGLLAGLWAALARLGWALPVSSGGLVGVHGPLMIGGVLGALIALERAVALAGVTGQRWGYLAPLCSGLGAVILVLGFVTVAKVLITAGSLGLLAIFVFILRRHAASYTIVMTCGAVALIGGNLLWWAGQPIYQAVHWWIAFLVLTIVGERLELSRVTRLTSTATRLFLLVAGIYSAGVVLTLFNLDAGIRLAGIGEIGLAVWLLRYDIARHTIKRNGLPQFIAACLLAGYVWLGISGLIGLTSGAVYAGFLYDALLHAVLLGFVFSMIFGHAPIIIPSLTGRAIRWHHFAYGYLVLLHGSLILREAGDLLAWMPGRMWGGMLNVTAVLIFLAFTIYAARQSEVVKDEYGAAH
ncbi:MAG: hypothetical protein K8L97_20960 [Anaerolineae bacterium]|nr:hypothetical protein [Anaerolineae bacterium]